MVIIRAYALDDGRIHGAFGKTAKEVKSSFTGTWAFADNFIAESTLSKAEWEKAVKAGTGQ